MATLGPHMQHSFMSSATWHPRQGKQKVPQRPVDSKTWAWLRGAKKEERG